MVMTTRLLNIDFSLILHNEKKRSHLILRFKNDLKLILKKFSRNFVILSFGLSGNPSTTLLGAQKFH